jgi:hypothetical protein
MVRLVSILVLVYVDARYDACGMPIGGLTWYMASTPQLSHGPVSEVGDLSGSLQGGGFSAGAMMKEECLVAVVVGSAGMFSSSSFLFTPVRLHFQMSYGPSNVGVVGHRMNSRHGVSYWHERSCHFSGSG